VEEYLDELYTKYGAFAKLRCDHDLGFELADIIGAMQVYIVAREVGGDPPLEWIQDARDRLARIITEEVKDGSDNPRVPTGTGDRDEEEVPPRA